jgi:hypothetical protein
MVTSPRCTSNVARTYVQSQAPNYSQGASGGGCRQADDFQSWNNLGKVGEPSVAPIKPPFHPTNQTKPTVSCQASTNKRPLPTAHDSVKCPAGETLPPTSMGGCALLWNFPSVPPPVCAAVIVCVFVT